MLARAGVLGCVFVRRVVAASRATAFLARAQVDPLRTDLHTFLALLALRALESSNSADMRTALLRHTIRL